MRGRHIRARTRSTAQLRQLRLLSQARASLYFRPSAELMLHPQAPNKASVPVIGAALLTQAESADCPRLLVCPGAR
jgi:hypothetical protein